jgi:hypothetical protein
MPWERRTPHVTSQRMQSPSNGNQVSTCILVRFLGMQSIGLIAEDNGRSPFK